MKIFFIFIILALGYGVWYMYPVVNQMRSCYEQNREDFDEIAVRTRTRGWSERSICESKFDSINRLSQCLDGAWTDVSPLVKEYFGAPLRQIRRFIQPFKVELPLLKQEFNRDCKHYSDLLFEETPPAK